MNIAPKKILKNTAIYSTYIRQVRTQHTYIRTLVYYVTNFKNYFLCTFHVEEFHIKKKFFFCVHPTIHTIAHQMHTHFSPKKTLLPNMYVIIPYYMQINAEFHAEFESDFYYFFHWIFGELQAIKHRPFYICEVFYVKTVSNKAILCVLN